MNKLVIYRDTSGKTCVRGCDSQVATFLEMDIRDDDNFAQSLVAKLEDAEYTSQVTAEYHRLSIRSDSVIIESNFEDRAPARHLPRSEMLVYMREWLRFLRVNESL